MSSSTRIKVRSVHDNDRHQLANLIHFETYVHRHLDWRPPLDWIGHAPYLVAERDEDILAALVCPPDPPKAAWIRLFAVSSNWHVSDAWNTLWAAAREQLHAIDEVFVAAIPLQQWFRSILEKSGFILSDNVVSLVWQRGTSLTPPKDLPFRIRPMNFDDITAVEELDWKAFGDLWRNSRDSLMLAYKQHAVATVAEDDNGLVGYQISTASPMGGHLARLAVHPNVQSKGIGFALVRDALDQFERRGAIRVSVNTQEANAASLSLYRKSGFRLTGEVYPVYIYGPNSG